MKEKLRNVLMLASLVAATGVAADVGIFEEFCPMIGAEYKHTFMQGNVEWKKATRSSYPGGTIYVGGKFNPYWGVELGYSLFGGTRKVDFKAGDQFPENANAVRTGGSLKTTTRIQGPHLDVNGYFPVNDCVDLMASIGLGFYQPHLKGIASSTDAFYQAEIDNLKNLKGKSAAVLRLGIGGIYMATESFGIRAKLEYLGTQALKVKMKDLNSALGDVGYSFSDKVFKNAFSVGLGAFIKF